MNDYERVAGIIRYMGTHFREQPDLDLLASRAGLSRFHFHRLFQRWAGVTPKAFLQCLTGETALLALRQGESVLDAALDSGLSGPGRLHDLCLKLEAATPGEVKSGGEGWRIEAGACQTPFGRAMVASNPRGICRLAFTDDDAAVASFWQELAVDWPKANLVRNDKLAAALARRIFRNDQSEQSTVPLRAYVRGTPFQIRVWRALLEIPPGRLVSYGRLARAAGCPGTARAVGSTLAGNPLAYLIPCHRVIRSGGGLGGYRWGGDRKRTMIAWENAVTGNQLQKSVS